jgi:hypothetical protein
VIVAQPQVIGVAVVAQVLGYAPWTIRAKVRDGDPRVAPGYLGKISNKHCWNAAELFGDLFTSDDALRAYIASAERAPYVPDRCFVDDCRRVSGPLGLCPRHARRFLRAWDRAEFSGVSLIQLVALCRWVTERWAHLTIPEFDPWADTCITPGCNGAANLSGQGPLCTPCSTDLWDHLSRT